MRNLFVNRKLVNGPWGGGNNFLRAMFEYGPSFGYEISNNLNEKTDVIFVIDPRYDEVGISINEIERFKSANSRVKVAYRVNECDARKKVSNDVDPLVRRTSRVSDVCFFISKWLRTYHSSGWGCQNNHVILNGANTKFYHPGRSNKISLSNKKINLVTHHWSDNFMKGHDIYFNIDLWVSQNPGFTFTYIGRPHGKFHNTDVVKPIFGDDLAGTLGKFDVYISGSRFDPGPNHIVESLALDLPTYAHIDGGGACEMVGDDHVYGGWSELERILVGRNFTKNEFKPVDWKECVREYTLGIDRLF